MISNSHIARIFLLFCLTATLLLIVGEATFAAETQALSQSEQPASDFPLKPLHPAKVIIQMLVVGGLLAFWTFRPDPLRQMLQIGITAEVLYAMLQDQISARMCPEYFTVAHPRIEGLTNPTLMGITWGFLGAW